MNLSTGPLSFTFGWSFKPRLVLHAAVHISGFVSARDGSQGSRTGEASNPGPPRITVKRSNGDVATLSLIERAGDFAWQLTTAPRLQGAPRATPKLALLEWLSKHRADLAADAAAEVARWELDPGDAWMAGPTPNTLATYFAPAAPAQAAELSAAAEEALEDSLGELGAAEALPPLPPPEASPATPVLTEDALFDAVFAEEEPVAPPSALGTPAAPAAGTPPLEPPAAALAPSTVAPRAALPTARPAPAPSPLWDFDAPN